MTTTWIVVRTRVEGFHYWADAPEEVAFLRNNHRHEFHVAVHIEVRHDDRELEFFLCQRWLKTVMPPGEFGGQSCEMLAKRLLIRLQEKYGARCYKVEVSEDGENASIVEYDV